MVKKVEKELKARFGGKLEKIEENSFWAKHNAAWKGKDVSVWVMTQGGEKKKEDSLWCRWKGAKQALSVWEKLRGHAHQLTLLDSIVDEKEKEMALIFERATPLKELIPTLCSSELILVVWDVVTSLLELHESHDLSHNAVCVDTIAVVHNERRRCVMTDLQYADHMDDHLAQNLVRSRPLRPFSTPEEDSAVTITYKGTSVWCRDSCGIARLLQDMLEACNDSNLNDWMERCLCGAVMSRSSVELGAPQGGFLMSHEAAVPPVRPSLEQLKGLSLFKSCALVKIAEGLDTLFINQAEYFSTLFDLLKNIPYIVFETALLPAFLSKPFWKAPGSSIFTPHLIGSDNIQSCLQQQHRSLVIEFILSSLQNDKDLRVPMLKISEHVLKAIDTSKVGTVLDLSIQCLGDSEDHDSVYWGIHCVLVAVRCLLGGSSDELILEKLNTKVVPLLVSYSLGVRFKARVRSAALLGFVQLVSLDSQITSVDLLPSIAGALLSGDEELAHHALNAVVMCENILPYSILALEILPLLATVLLSPDSKLREKCHQVTTHILESLNDIDGSECEDFDTPPLIQGCPLATPPQLSKEDKRFLKQNPPSKTSTESTNGVSGPVFSPSRERVHDTVMRDVEWDKSGLLLVKENEPKDLMTVGEVCECVDSLQKPGTHKGHTKKKKGTKKKRGNGAVTPVDKGIEDSELLNWENKTFNPDGGEPFSSTLASSLAHLDASVTINPGPSSAGDETLLSSTEPTPTAKKKKKKAKKKAVQHLAPVSPVSASVSVSQEDSSHVDVEEDNSLNPPSTTHSETSFLSMTNTTTDGAVSPTKKKGMKKKKKKKTVETPTIEEMPSTPPLESYVFPANPVGSQDDQAYQPVTIAEEEGRTDTSSELPAPVSPIVPPRSLVVQVTDAERDKKAYLDSLLDELDP
eukprot:TRINITY_DN11296_c0_g1_i1.p1 TRINITY_DN11296_c0_g1~~TRINITY_DN11296_c0_g1_i1.p1  ORF type:complete len:919 (+),score=145.44 TRINITY_DN11296_c0_g1_i1:65-2821(+)